MKLETFQGKPKRKYIRKVKNEDILNNNIQSYLQNENIENNDEDIMNNLDNLIKKNEEEELSNGIKKMRLNDNIQFSEKVLFENENTKNENIKVQLKEEIKNLNNIQHNIEIISTINRAKITKVEKVYYNPNVINVQNYEFMTPINVYLYYVSERISLNVTKYIIYTHNYKKIDHHILCSTNKPFEYKEDKSNVNKSEVIQLTHNVTLYVKEYIQNKRDYSYKNCQEVLNKKRKKEVIENSFDYDFCQLYLDCLSNNHKNSYIFEYENKYFSFTYDIYNNEYKTPKLLTN